MEDTHGGRVLIEHGGLPHLLPLAVHLKSFILKSYGWLGGGLLTFSVSLSPLGTNWALELNETWLGLGLGILGLRVWG